MDGRELRPVVLTVLVASAAVLAGGCDSIMGLVGLDDDGPFDAVYLGEPLNVRATDPMVFSARHFSDGAFRIVVQASTGRTLYRTEDFRTFTVIDSTWLSGEPRGGPHSFQDHIVLPDGKFVLYQNDGSGGTSVWTGPDLGRLREQGTVLPEGDCGVVYERSTGTVHIFSEDRDHMTEDGLGSDRLSHWTTPGDDLLRATQRADAVDLTGVAWHTGDPDLIRIDGRFYMFMDRSEIHPAYHIAVAESEDLREWRRVQDNLTPAVKGGDLALTRRDSVFEAMTEYSGSDERGIGHWRVRYASPDDHQ